MEDQRFNDVKAEEFSDLFVCCICLDLLYKPIVLACGHISCFWCVHKSMNGLRESHCPICRHPYFHFPTVCQMLHFLLLKMYPNFYRIREKQTLEEEKESGYFSPQLHANAHGPIAEVEDPRTMSQCSNLDSEYNPQPDTLSNNKEECPVHVKQLGLTTVGCNGGNLIHTDTFDGKSEATGTLLVEGEKLPKISVADLQCLACNKLLIRPVVLNCGHAFCETCIVSLAGEMLICQVCQSPHPRGLPKVCLELDHFLESQFTQEYATRKESIALKEIITKEEVPSTCSKDNSKQGESLAAWWSDPQSKVHCGVGCDFCGMYPILGDRYRCKDCVEKIGFDLCGDCYNTRSKLPGRFNQQHTPEHKFELVQSNIIRLVSRQRHESSNSSSAHELPENSEFIFHALVISDNDEEMQDDSEPSN